MAEHTVEAFQGVVQLGIRTRIVAWPIGEALSNQYIEVDLRSLMTGTFNYLDFAVTVCYIFLLL